MFNADDCLLQNTEQVGWSNRAIKPEHVNDLATAFKVKINRSEPAKQLRISVTAGEMKAHLAHTVKVLTNLQKLPNNPHKIDHVPTVGELKRDMQEALKITRPFEDMPIVFCDPAVASPQLDCGQHRRAAMIQLYGKDTAKVPQIPAMMHVSINPWCIFDQLFERYAWTSFAYTDNLWHQSLGWACQVIDIDQVDPRYFRIIRVNQIDVYKPDGEGDVYLQVESVYDEFLEKERRDKTEKTKTKDKAEPGTKGKPKRPRPDRWDDFLVEHFGFRIKDSRRYLTVLGNDFWRLFAKRYNMYSFGRESYKAHHFSTALGQHMDEVSTWSPLRTIVRIS